MLNVRISLQVFK